MLSNLRVMYTNSLHVHWSSRVLPGLLCKIPHPACVQMYHNYKQLLQYTHGSVSWMKGNRIIILVHTAVFAKPRERIDVFVYTKYGGVRCAQGMTRIISRHSDQMKQAPLAYCCNLYLRTHGSGREQISCSSSYDRPCKQYMNTRKC